LSRTMRMMAGYGLLDLKKKVRQIYERTALSHNKATMLQQEEMADPDDALTPEQGIKAPFVLDSLNR
jgi:predicted nuclease of restriction endonuclease-like (RecB) superfamily